jgi:hypothetical protein
MLWGRERSCFPWRKLADSSLAVDLIAIYLITLSLLPHDITYSIVAFFSALFSVSMSMHVLWMFYCLYSWDRLKKMYGI